MANNKRQKKRKSVSPNAPLTVSAAPPSASTGDARRDALLNSITAAQKAVERESASGFGERSKNAAQHLKSLQKDLADYDASNDPIGKAYKIGVNVGMPIAGMYLGHKLGKNLTAKHVAAVNARNKEITKLAKRAENIMGKARVTTAHKSRLRGIVQAADHLGLDRVKGPVGAVTAGLLAIDAVVARAWVAPQIENEQAKELVRSAGTGFGFAATALIGEGLVRNQTMKTMPPAPALASINNARLVSGVATAPTGIKAAVSAGKTSVVGNALKVVGKAALRVVTPVVVGVAAYGAFSASARAGDRKTTSLARGTTAALDTVAMNIPSEANKQLRKTGHGSVPEFISNTLLQAFGQRPRNTLPRAVPAQNKRPPILSARGSANPAVRIASAGKSKHVSASTIKVQAHIKDRGGKGIFTKAHVRINSR